ncbi:MAG TPA: M23 family metallopeptidase [Tahibacter sp.]|uniref:M23 family metallopeptidase n=1 Tax=Tahibacter sp. TaxID=2056211 RepID=UPI002CDD1835|nr:M23 family metallopeptidase [Tahibacter sp.]HSX62299.1 M23 family metallopeptidase [Tahibacter sp.]
MHRFLAVAAAGLLGAACGAAAATEPPRESFDLRVRFAPAVYPVGGHATLVYELELNNYTADTLEPTAVAVIDADRGEELLRYEAAELAQHLDRSGLQRPVADGGGIASGRRGIVFVELTLPPRRPLPKQLRHRVDYRVAATTSAAHTVEGGEVAVRSKPVTVLGPPLRGGPWVAVYDPSWERGHRRVVFAVDGKARTPGRHAADWVRVDETGRKQRGDGHRAADTYSYGEDVLAVADGTVVKVRNDLPERQLLTERAKHDLATGSGNVVALDIGGGRFAYYGHLRTGSVRVRVGQRVRKGETIAQVGFSGSASDPQLHFHLGDAPDALAAEGLPFVFDRFRALGRYGDIAKLGRQVWLSLDDGMPDERKREMPVGNGVVEFGK